MNSTDASSFTVEKQEVYTFYVILFFLLLPGVFLNILVIAISSKKSIIDKPYRWFIWNQSFISLIFSIVSGSHIIFPVVNGLPETMVTFCGFIACLVTALIPLLTIYPAILTLSRYIGMYYPHSYGKFFTNLLVWCYCSLINLSVVVSLSVVVALFGNYEPRNAYDIFCRPRSFAHEHLGVRYFARMVFAINAVVWNFLLAFCAVKIWIKLRHHQTVLNNLHQQQKITQNKEILKLITIQAILPVIAMIPQYVVSIAMIFFETSLPYVGTFATFLISLVPLLNAAATLKFLTTYRLCFENFMKGLKEGKLRIELQRQAEPDHDKDIHLHERKDHSDSKLLEDECKTSKC